METQKKIEITTSKDSVRINVKETADFNGNAIVVKNDMGTFPNSPKGREIVKKKDIPENFIASIFEVWGDEPTVEDPEMPEVKKQ